MKTKQKQIAGKLAMTLVAAIVAFGAHHARAVDIEPGTKTLWKKLSQNIGSSGGGGSGGSSSSSARTDSNFGAFDLDGASGKDAVVAAMASSPAAHIMQNTLRTSVLKLDPLFAGSGSKENGDATFGSFGVGVDTFYDQANLKGLNTSVDTFGVNLQAVSGDQLQLRLTAPIHVSSIGNVDLTTYGLDAGLQYKAGSGFSIGGHAGFLLNDLAGTSVYDLAMGPTLGYRYQINDKLDVAAGVSLDYLYEETGFSTWMAGLALKAGWKVTDHLTISPYYAYYRNLDLPLPIDVDWHDLGVEAGFTFDKWTANIGAKTTVSYANLGDAFQIYGGVGFKF